jgi:hypothetical protein
MPPSEKSLYTDAKENMKHLISLYLKITGETAGLSNLLPEHFEDEETRELILAGFGSSLHSQTNVSSKQAWSEWDRRKAIHFDVEAAVSFGVYHKLRAKSEAILNEIERSTNSFSSWDAEQIRRHPYWLPLLQRIAGVFSKSALKRVVGSVSDTGISQPGAQRLASFLGERVISSGVVKNEVLQRLEATLEGIVRDLVGRVLLEKIVESALESKNLPYKKEEEYNSLRGVVYNFRSDFVIPNENNPKVFIEVRKSSSRHASLYAKDKMFSAINWKGANEDMIGVIVVDGPWTEATLRVMANVFDYVVPMERVNDLAETIEAYIHGDRSKLKWLIKFKITDASHRTS